MNSWAQGRYACMECKHKGRLKGGFTIRSTCQACHTYMILPLTDAALESHDGGGESTVPASKEILKLVRALGESK